MVSMLILSSRSVRELIFETLFTSMRRYTRLWAMGLRGMQLPAPKSVTGVRFSVGRPWDYLGRGY